MESTDAALERWEKLKVLQEGYPEFVPFLRDMMQELGFSTSEIQEDIAEYMQHGPAYLMVQAQRGEAKTTIAAIFVVWNLIHQPKLRALVVSAGETQANEISTLIVQLIKRVDILEMMRPDKSQGDRTSVEHFDIHYTLKGMDKSPSVACVGINSNLPGKRADLLIADDVESPKNSMTAVQRANLEHLTKEFSSISVSRQLEDGTTLEGRILWLGTPQSVESVYNNLPQRGVTTRIWPGRIPTPAQQQHYGDMLAPIILRRILSGALRTGFGLDGTQGEATDPLLRNENELLKQEIDKGVSGFQLQFMLLTAMTDALRFPLKTLNLVHMRFIGEKYPMTVVRGFGGSATKQWSVNGRIYHTSFPHTISPELGNVQSKVMYIDPAGGGMNADETGYVIGGLLNSNIYINAIGGVPGGYAPDNLKALADLVVLHRPNIVKIEKNMGFGSFKEILQPIIKAACEAAGIPGPQIEDDMVSGQKELRIINTVEPIIGRGSVIIDEAVFEAEAASLQRYDIKIRDTYSFLFQLSKLTRDRGSLIHDDRIDAFEGLLRHFTPALAVDQIKAIAAQAKREFEKIMQNPLGLSNNALMQLGKSKRPSSPLAKRIRKL